jgi:hypothetical protein
MRVFKAKSKGKRCRPNGGVIFYSLLNSKSFFGIGLFGLLLLLLSQGFHYPIHIANALTGEKASEFAVKIDAWRIFWEPFLGPLLFFQRTDQPVEEYFALFVALSILLLIFSILKPNRKEFSLKNSGFGFLKGLLNLPLLFVCWLAALLFLLFVALPANTIINHSKDRILLNTHAHTEYSHDGLITQEEQMEWHQKNGFDAFFITDHNNHKKTLEAVEKQRNGQLPDTPLLICGEEYSGSNHLILLGLKEDFKSKGLGDSIVIDTVHKLGGIVLVAHWFDGKGKHDITHYTRLGADGFEIANQGVGIHYDRTIYQKIKAHCQANGLIMTGVCDYHGHGSTAFSWNALKIPNWNSLNLDEREAAIMDIFKSKDQSKLAVLVYKDRKVFDRNLYWLSPFYTIVGYFRTLNLWQVLSWLIWLLVLRFINQKFIGKLTFPSSKIIPNFNWLLVSLIACSFILYQGIRLRERANYITGTNKIYDEYSGICLTVGIPALIYITLLLIISNLKKTN